jgi:serine/threonine-protein kinase
LNASTGTTAWTYITGNAIVATPTVVNGVVYIGSFDHNVYALNASNGSFIWSYPTGGPVESSAAIADGVLYVGSNDDNV